MKEAKKYGSRDFQWLVTNSLESEEDPKFIRINFIRVSLRPVYFFKSDN